MKCYQKDYPRPQFVRKNWTNLNGTWKFGFDRNLGMEIQVPFTYETALSGIGITEPKSEVWYEMDLLVSDEESLRENRLILHFEGSDFETRVWVNDSYIGSHKGGYARFSFDITDAIRMGDNVIRVQVLDSLSMEQPRGKQRWVKDSFACWYVQTTGIWKTVWCEWVPVTSIDKLRLTPDIEHGCICVSWDVKLPETAGPIGANQDNEDLEMEIIVSYKGNRVAKMRSSMAQNGRKASGSAKISVKQKELVGNEWQFHCWSPENPELYDIAFVLYQKGNPIDEVQSYFGMREIRIEGNNILLNGRPLYQRLILDQGYWEDSHLTPPDEEALILDIDRIHALGYNGLRKHQKIEDERFLYWCDVKGMLVWSEMAASYEYTPAAVQDFTREWMEIVEQNGNHPCIITWTPFNESWGVGEIAQDRTMQAFTEAIYYLTKSVDPTRPVVTNDGWEHTCSDILTLHDYEEKGEILKERYLEWKDAILNNELSHANYKFAWAKGHGYHGQPVIISEFGGIAYQKKGEGWGYGNKVEDEEAFLKRFDSITTAIKELPYVCGYCYTQITDVQQEVNGLLDSRRAYKADPDKVKEINERRVGVCR